MLAKLYSGDAAGLRELTQSWGYTDENDDEPEPNSVLKRAYETYLRSINWNIDENQGNSELRSWRNSLGYLARILTDSKIDKAKIICELQLKNGRRADCLIICKNSDGYHIFVLEIKQWSKVRLLENGEYKIIYTKKIPGKDSKEKELDYNGIHPLQQAKYYAEHLHQSFHNKSIRWKPLCLLHNYTKKPEDPIYARIRGKDKYSIFLDNDIARFIKRIKKFCTETIEDSFMHDLIDGKNYQTRDLTIQALNLSEDMNKIKLTKEQEIALGIIKKAIRSCNEKKAIMVVNGVPGAGKTLLAKKSAHEALQYYTESGENGETRIALGSKATLQTMSGNIDRDSVESNKPLDNYSLLCFHNSIPEASKIAILDEGHRISLNLQTTDRSNSLRRLINQCRVILIFQDTLQSIRSDESSPIEWIKRILEDSKIQDFSLIFIDLKNSERFPLSGAYVEWVDKFSEGEINPWQNPKHTVTVLDSFQEIDRLYYSRIAQNKSSIRKFMIGSPNVKKKTEFKEGEDIIYKYYPISMEDQNGPRSHKLIIPDSASQKAINSAAYRFNNGDLPDLIGSIYECYNFEYDFTIIYFPSYIRFTRQRGWSIEEESGTLGSEITSDKLPKIIRLFMTRATVGTILFIEDKDSREEVKRMLSGQKTN